jgi:phenylacetate-coenzyme A ligase PaaK-like adenylate-forming protein
MDTRLRALADDLVKRRDGLAGWRAHRRHFRALVRATPEQVARHSTDRLRDMLRHAFETVPYYRARWSAIGFMPTATTSLETVRGLPLLTKADIRERRPDMVSQAVPAEALELDYTGGTTGTQTSFFRDRACRAARVGRQHAVLEQCGYRRGARRGFIWGAHADLPAASADRRLKQWVRRFASADEVLCCTVMSRTDLLAFHARLRRFRPSVLYGYPNAIEQFARFVEREGLAPIRVGRVFCTAEALREGQRALLAAAFGAEVFNLYCSREHGCVGFECGQHDRLHIDAGSAFVEILVDGRPAAPGESGQIVVTDLLNRGMPLIRYVTGDLATAAPGVCVCGSPLPALSSLDGRVADILYRADGSIVAGLMLDDLFMDEPSITHAQFRQDDPSSLDVALVMDPNATPPPDLDSRVIGEVQSIMGSASQVRVHRVPDIGRHPRSGKYRSVICNVQPS